MLIRSTSSSNSAVLLMVVLLALSIIAGGSEAARDWPGHADMQAGHTEQHVPWGDAARLLLGAGAGPSTKAVAEQQLDSNSKTAAAGLSNVVLDSNSVSKLYTRCRGRFCSPAQQDKVPR